ncbi:hypothetical protein EV126DRAFT_139812 [Verticillium dahliae]|nr:hypothetical protein EV126DRAFT_188993 [Verticillium dahliae]KAH6685511.1 hypothetical protein EV126DRAFT_139812 [Verticillium dahliae]
MNSWYHPHDDTLFFAPPQTPANTPEIASYHVSRHPTTGPYKYIHAHHSSLPSHQRNSSLTQVPPPLLSPRHPPTRLHRLAVLPNHLQPTRGRRHQGNLPQETSPRKPPPSYTLPVISSAAPLRLHIRLAAKATRLARSSWPRARVHVSIPTYLSREVGTSATSHRHRCCAANGSGRPTRPLPTVTASYKVQRHDGGASDLDSRVTLCCLSSILISLDLICLLSIEHIYISQVPSVDCAATRLLAHLSLAGGITHYKYRLACRCHQRMSFSPPAAAFFHGMSHHASRLLPVLTMHHPPLSSRS